MAQTSEPVPFVSTVSQSRLAVRAVLTQDWSLLEKIASDRERVHSLATTRSIANKAALHRYFIVFTRAVWSFQTVKTKNLKSIIEIKVFPPDDGAPIRSEA